MPSLRRVSDGAGDSGPMSMLFKCKPLDDWFEQVYDENNKPVVEYGRPKLHYMVRVGSPYARSYAPQDYWTTTPVTEILEETDDMVRFRTTNSEYIWRE